MKKIFRYSYYYFLKYTIYPFFVRRAISEIEKKDNDFKSITEHNLDKILFHATRKVKAYKKISLKTEGEAIKKLKEFPVVDRSELKKNTRKYLASPLIPYTEFNTSGSTGDPLFFYRSLSASAWDDAHQIKNYYDMGYKKGDKIIIFSGYYPDKKKKAKHIYWARKSKFGEMPFGSLQFSSNDLNKNTIRYYFRKIESIKPAIIRGYPSAINSLITLMRKENLRFDHNIKAVLLSSENIFDYQVEKISSFLNTKVYRQYGHSECAVFAMSDALSTEYKVSPYYGYVEILDEDLRPVSVGEKGQIIVTGYKNKKQPFIRYKTGDVGVNGGVKDGAQVIKEITGREQDYLVTRKGDYIPITSIVAGRHFKINEYIERWRIVQLEKAQIKIEIEGNTAPDSCLREVELTFKPYVDVEFCFLPSIPKSKSGKFKFFHSQV